MASTINEEGMERLALEVCDWCLAHGIVMKFKDEKGNCFANHVPVSALPSPFPRKQFMQARKIAPYFNVLIHRVSKDLSWMKEKLKVTKQGDHFTAHLLDIAEEVYVVPNRSTCPALGLFRSDYMLHEPNGESCVLQQVEINTIASAFGPMGSLTQSLHRAILSKLDFCPEGFSEAGIPNEPNSGKVFGKAVARANQMQIRDYPEQPSSAVTNERFCAFVVLQDELNTTDQRHLEYAISENGVNVRRLSMHDIKKRGVLDDSVQPPALLVDGEEVGVVYYRWGYIPDHYGEDEWSTRKMVEMSRAIKCPSVPYQLAGCKKIQQSLADEDVLRHFLPEPAEASMITELMDCFTGLWPLDTGDCDQVCKMVLASPRDYVMKPQREGGGNNVYGEELRKTIPQMSKDDLAGYIIMSRIRPRAFPAIFVRHCKAYRCEALTELGVFSAVLSSPNEEVEMSEVGGSVLRSKVSSADEGGISAGIGVVDSVYLQ